MPSYPKRDKGFARCASCRYRGNWSTACQPCENGSNFEPRPSETSTARQRVLGNERDNFQHSPGGSADFQHSNQEAEGSFPTSKNDFPTFSNIEQPDTKKSGKIATFQHLSNIFQHSAPPTTISYGGLQNGILSVLFKGLDIHYTQIAHILGVEPKKVSAVLSRLVKDPNMPVSKYINQHGQPVKGRYIMDPEFKLELELLDAPLMVHNLRFYPRPCDISQHSGGERMPFTTLFQHLGDVSAPRGNGRFWHDEFLGRSVNFVQDGKAFWVEVGASQEPFSIPELWELVRYIAGRFGLDAYKFDWKMEFESNQDISPLQMENGQMVEIWVAGELYRAYQKWAGKNGGQPVLRVEKPRSESEAMDVIKGGAMIDKEHISSVMEKGATIRASLSRLETIEKEFKAVVAELDHLLTVPSRMSELTELNLIIGKALAKHIKQQDENVKAGNEDRLVILSLVDEIAQLKQMLGVQETQAQKEEPKSGAPPRGYQ